MQSFPSTAAYPTIHEYYRACSTLIMYKVTGMKGDSLFIASSASRLQIGIGMMVFLKIVLDI